MAAGVLPSGAQHTHPVKESGTLEVNPGKQSNLKPRGCFMPARLVCGQVQCHVNLQIKIPALSFSFQTVSTLGP
jgi:hypothetical protein